MLLDMLQLCCCISLFSSGENKFSKLLSHTSELKFLIYIARKTNLLLDLGFSLKHVKKKKLLYAIHEKHRMGIF